jgi:alpha-methylacyl-CoA racemase
MSFFFGHLAAGSWRDERGINVLDGGAPWYDVYETADGKHIAIGAIEERFYTQLLDRLGLDPVSLPSRDDRAQWGGLRATLSNVFKQKSRDEWCKALEGSDVCFAPVLSLTEAPMHPHHRARGTFIKRDGIVQPAPTPRFSRTPGDIVRGAPKPGQGGAAALTEWGVDAATIERFRAAGAVILDD